MTDLRKAAEMALEALEWNYGTDLCDIENCMAWLDKMNATIPALRKALAQPEQREWQGLTDEDLKPLCDEWKIMYGGYVDDFAKAIEAKLKEKNI